MAYNSILFKKELVLVFDGGIVDGKQKEKSRTFSNIKSESTDAQMHTIGVIVNSLVDDDLLKVQSRIVNVITED